VVIRSFGRTRSRGLRAGRSAVLAESLPAIAFDPAEVAGETWLEIGFGGGEHLAAQATRHPGVRLIGAEPFVNGLASAARHVREGGLANVRLFPGDARDLLAILPGASLARIFLLFPDPWPKARHRKRRLVNADFAAEAARVLAAGGRLRFATDWADYAHQALEVMGRESAFAWTAERADDWRLPPPDHFPTRYEAKRLGDCAPVWLEFERV
jgi:tRNA (guanine-N7-)-methyltransferase